jgi:DhnA family fructose-bisphosphate aldolase class Ia
MNEVKGDDEEEGAAGIMSGRNIYFMPDEEDQLVEEKRQS